MTTYSNNAITASGLLNVVCPNGLSITTSPNTSNTADMSFHIPVGNGQYYFQDTSGGYTNYFNCGELWTNGEPIHTNTNGNTDYANIYCGGISTNGNITTNNYGTTMGSGVLTFSNGSTINDNTQLVVSTDDNIYFQTINDGGNFYFKSNNGNNYNNTINCGNIQASSYQIQCGTLLADSLGGTRITISQGNTWGYGQSYGGYYNTGQQTNYESNHTYEANNYSIIAAGDVISYGGSFIAFSDKRTKTNVININSNNSLEIIRRLTPINYEYIDNQGYKKLGFIAQDVKKFIPTSVTFNKNYIPNVYEIVKVTNKNTIQLDIKTRDNFEIYDIVKLKFFVVDYNGKIKKEILATLNEFIDDKCFTINENIEHEFVFLYGQEVNDIHCLDYNQTNIINISAVQQLDKELQETKNIIANQQQQIDNLQQQIQALSGTTGLL